MFSSSARAALQVIAVALVLSSVGSVVGAAPEPTPQQRAEATRLNKEALADRDAGRYDAAIEKLRRALTLYSTPTTVYNLARTYETAEEFALARDHYKLCLSKEPTTRIRRLAEEKLAGLEKKLSKGRLVVEVTPPGAHVFVDGRAIGGAPVAPQQVPAKKQRVHAELDGYQREERWVDVPGAGEAQVRLALVPLERLGSLIIEVAPTAAEVWLDDEPLGTAPLPRQRLAAGTHRVRAEMAGYETETEEVTVAPGAATTVALRLEPSRSGPDYSPWTWVTLGSGLALVAGGGLAYGLGEADHKEVAGTSGYGQASSGVVADRSYDSARGLVESGDDKKLAGYVLWGVGGAALVASTVLFVLEEVGDGGDTAVMVTGTGTDGGGFVSLSGRF